MGAERGASETDYDGSGGKKAKGPVFLAAVLATMAVAFLAAPALADVAGGGDIPDYALQEDGTVLIDGDLATDCRSFDGGPIPPADGDPDREQARRVLEQCEEAGLLDSGRGDPGASAVNGEGGGLPDTGGPDLPALLFVAVLVAAAGGLLARKLAAG